MKSVRIRAFLWGWCFASSTTLLSRLASADAASDLTAKGRINVNDQRPQLPAVAADSPAGGFGYGGPLTLFSDAGGSNSRTSTVWIDQATPKPRLRTGPDYLPVKK